MGWIASWDITVSIKEAAVGHDDNWTFLSRSHPLTQSSRLLLHRSIYSQSYHQSLESITTTLDLKACFSTFTKKILKMHPFTLIIALSAAALALPQPQPQSAADRLSDTILEGLSSVIGTPNRHRPEGGNRGRPSQCRRPSNGDEISACVSDCVTQCLVDNSGCNTCIRGCTSRWSCDDVRNDRNDRNDRDDRNRENDRPNHRRESMNLDDGGI
ncbi:hypothetical protein F4677DRAFT_422439 [Hypoxylon crocopeplum]|nr:hypothetical protein F4677DRAFT_422439 [Hypoxylon crocopeplum]